MPPLPPPPPWSNVKRLFDEALAQPPAGREAFVRGAEVDAALRAEVLSLLAHHDEAADTSPFLAEGAAAAVLTDPSRIGERLGPWQIVRLLGSGGMGDVFEAIRADGQFDGRAALKLLKRGMDSQAVLRRFALERQALARLNHPHIARLFDAGQSADGLPYFVMELVDGLPIDEAAAPLTTEQRVRLFLQLTDAVAYAHQQLLVHRDLKPANVLVTPQGQLKLLDFGIAKALDPLAAEGEAGLTHAGQRPYTPTYASPEQVRGEAVSTATDVYSLGVLLYTLLTGQRPYGRDATTPAATARAVLDEPPRPASQVMRLPADLDNILAKALRKPVNERYASVDAFAADLRAWLGGYPVSARPPAWGYVALKFVRRHGLAVGLAGAAFGAIAGLSVVAALSAAQARASLSEARRLAAVMVFDVNDALQRGALEGRQALVKTANDFFDAQLKDGERSPAALLVSAQASARLAEIEGQAGNANLGDLAAANRRYAQALALYRRVPDSSAEAPDAWRGQAAVHRDLAEQQASAGDAAAGLREVAEGLAAADRGLVLAPAHAKLYTMRCNLMMMSMDLLYSQNGQAQLGRLAEALARADDTLACARENLLRRPGHLISQQLLSAVLVRQSLLKLHAGQVDAAVALARENVAVIEAAAGPAPDGDWTDFLVSAHGALGFALQHRAGDAEAFAELARAVAIARRHWEGDRADRHARQAFADVSYTLGDAHLAAGHRPEAGAACRQATEALRAGVLADPRPAEVQAYLQAQRCTLEAERAPLPAIEAAVAEGRVLIDRLPAAGNTPLPWLQMRLLRLTLLQRRSDNPRLFGDARTLLDELGRWEQQNPGSAEYAGSAAALRHEAAALPWHGLTAADEALRCGWARAAAQRFEALAAAHTLDTTLSDMARAAAERARHCAQAV
jgi:tetratricopeptide (TPR) repeat protein